MPHETIAELTSIDTNIESLFIRLSNVVIGALYRPPSGILPEFMTFLENTLDSFGPMAVPIVILGDVNIDSNSDSPSSRELKDIIHAHAFQNTIRRPTRVTTATATCLDVCITNIENSSLKCGVLSCDLSDHMPIFCLAPVTTKKYCRNSIFFTRQINKQSLESFAHRIEVETWDHVYDDHNPRTAFTSFRDKFLEIYNTSFPLRKCKTQHKKIRKPWITPHLYKTIKEKDRLYYKFVRTQEPTLFSEFKQFRNKLNTELKKAKCEYYEQRFMSTQGDQRKMWNLINDVMNRKPLNSNVKEVLINNRLVTGQELANEMNCHFVNIGNSPEETDGVDSYTLQCSLSSSIMFAPTSPCEIFKIIQDLCNQAAAGYDEVKALPLKYTAHIASSILTHIINKMFETGYFPDELKIARVTPVYKGGGETEINNYRPISVLPMFSKIFERVINDRLTNFFEKHQIINNAQYGFQKNKGTEMALVHIKEKIVENIEKKLLTLGLFLDLRKAFDTVQHKILLKKLECYGVRGVALSVMKSYLADRTQYVCVGNIFSTKMKITSGVPQGSILGPLLFLIYINDITTIPGSTDMIMYADDTNIFFSGTTKKCLEQAANSYLIKLSNWLHNNQLSLNTSKTKYIIFKPINKRDPYNIRITYNGTTLDRVVEQKFLGVWFAEDLTWTAHVNSLRSDLSRVTGQIYQIHKLIPNWLKQTLYYSLFYSRLSYGILVWGTTTAYNYNKLIILQKKILRMCENFKGDRRDLRTRPLFIKYNMLKADQVYYFKLLQWIYRSGIYKLPSESAGEYNIRNPKRRPLPIRTNYGQQTIDFQSTKVLNMQELSMNFSDVPSTFKKKCRTLLVNTNVSVITR